VATAAAVDKVVTEQMSVEGTQVAWDATAAKLRLDAKIVDAKLRYDRSIESVNLSRLTLAVAEKRLAELRARHAELEQAAKNQVSRASVARRRMTDRMVDAYVRGDRFDAALLARLESPTELSRASQFLTSVASRDRDSVVKYREAIKGIDENTLKLADQIARQIDVVSDAREDVRVAEALQATVKTEWDAYAAGSGVFVQGFVFPVAAPVDFIDSWGYPRMAGTGYAHWHQGTDIMGPYGAPLIAAENGTIAKLGDASLGGKKLWVKGDGGTSYYYAHLSAFVPGMANGDRVCAGQVVGYLGDSGNAQGTPPHLHFEIHPDGGAATNPYPILQTSHSAQKELLELGPYVSPTATCTNTSAGTSAADPGATGPSGLFGTSGVSGLSGVSGQPSQLGPIGASGPLGLGGLSGAQAPSVPPAPTTPAASSTTTPTSWVRR
jgi:murein DD-endopeptidase MepM/ murein hydrolase activator NlpD